MTNNPYAPVSSEGRVVLHRAAHVCPVSSPPISDGAVAVENDRILSVGKWADVLSAYPGAPVQDHGPVTLTPALINAHTHVEGASLRGKLPLPSDFCEWIVALIRARRDLTPEAHEAAARQAVQELVAAGTVAVADISASRVSVAPLIAAGLRGTVFCELIGLDERRAEEHLRTGQDQIEAWSRLPGAKLTFGLSLHAPYTISAKLFRIASAWCRQAGVPLTIHLAESRAERSWAKHGFGPMVDVFYPAIGLADVPYPGVSPVAWLAEMGVLEAKPLLAHCVQLDADDVALLAQSGSTVAHCPRSNLLLRCGRAPVPVLWEAGVPLALGTDGLSSTPSLDMADEMDAAFDLHQSALTRADVLGMATLGGARALGLAADLGSLEPGKLAAFREFSLPEIGPVDAWA